MDRITTGCTTLIDQQESHRGQGRENAAGEENDPAHCPPVPTVSAVVQTPQTISDGAACAAPNIATVTATKRLAAGATTGGRAATERAHRIGLKRIGLKAAHAGILS